MARPDPILAAVAVVRPVPGVAARLPAPGSADLPAAGCAARRGRRRAGGAPPAAPGARLRRAGARTRARRHAAEADLEALLGERTASRLYPQKEALPYEESEPHLEIGGLRVEAVEALFSGRSHILVTTPRALQERVPIPAHLARLRLTLRVGDTVDLHDLAGTLEEPGLRARAAGRGGGAVRGPRGHRGRVLRGRRRPGAHRALGRRGRVHPQLRRPGPALHRRAARDARPSGGLPPERRRRGDGVPLARSSSSRPTRSWSRLGAWDLRRRRARAPGSGSTALYDDLVDSGASPPAPAQLFLEPDEVAALLGARCPAWICATTARATGCWTPRPARHRPGHGAARGATCARAPRAATQTLLLCDNDGQLQRLEEILGGPGRIPPGTGSGIGALSRGLRAPGRPIRRSGSSTTTRSSAARAACAGRRRFRGAVALESLAQLTPGDYVVHMDHGVGRFVGLEHIEVAGEEIEALAIEYAGGEILRLPVYRLDLVERWVGESEDARAARACTASAGSDGRRCAAKTEKAIEEMTAELLELYARRAEAAGIRLSAGHALAEGDGVVLPVRGHAGPAAGGGGREARHGVAPPHGPAGVRRRRLRQDRGGGARGLQGGAGRQAGGRARAHHDPRGAAPPHLRGAPGRLPRAGGGAQPLPLGEGAGSELLAERRGRRGGHRHRDAPPPLRGRASSRTWGSWSWTRSSASA